MKTKKRNPQTISQDEHERVIAELCHVQISNAINQAESYVRNVTWLKWLKERTQQELDALDLEE